MNTKPITVAIVEDNNEIRQRFVSLFTETEHIQCVGNYFTAEEFMSEFSSINPMVVFMDVHLPGVSGIECIEKMKEESHQTQFIVYTVFENSEVVLDAIKAGATGYLLKNTPSEKLVAAVEEIIRGESPMSGSIAAKVLKAFQNEIRKPESKLLSSRENEVVNLLSKGYRYKDIAKELIISPETVKTHIRSIYEKLQVNNSIDAINKTRSASESQCARYAHTHVKVQEEQLCFAAIESLFASEKPYLTEKYSLSALSKQVGYPLYVVSQTINRRYKVGFFELINQLRINESINMLRNMNEKISIEGVAYECGFCSRSSFYAAFKKLNGVTPTEFMQL